MKPRLFAGVQKLLQVGVFFLFSHRTCSSLFMQVGVSVGVNDVASMLTARLRVIQSSQLLFVVVPVH